MAREKGMGNLQREKSGRWTARVCVGGKRYCRSTRTKDYAKAEAFLNRLLAPLGLGERTIPFAEVWREYEKSPNRRELSPSTMKSKRVVWMHFAEWIELNHMEVTQLKQLTADAVAEYLRQFRANHCASTYNATVCVLRAVCRTVADKAGIVDDPWTGVVLLPDDSHTRRELSLTEVCRLMEAAERVGVDWKLLFCIGAYTGLRLGDCCTLEWTSVNLENAIIQLIPRKTKKYAHGRPVTIPIHPTLGRLLREKAKEREFNGEEGGLARSPYVLPAFADWYVSHYWKIGSGLAAIFKDAGIATSIQIRGRKAATPDATFHSLRHTFVSLTANAGVPLPVVQSIVGHSSTAMTRHYYHENEHELRRAVAAIPSIEELRGSENGKPEAERGDRGIGNHRSGPLDCARISIPARLKRLARYFSKGLISQEEYAVTRTRILAEI